MIRAPANRGTLQRAAIRIALAGGLAAGALLATQSWLDSRAAASSVAVPTAEVLVTARAVAAGATITAEDLRWQTWPRSLTGPGWTVRGAAHPPMVGRVLPASLAAGVPITAALAVAPGSGSVFAAAIRPGWRAASIAVTPAAGLAGFVEPGDRVDVLLTQTLRHRRTAQLLLTDLAVLGIDQTRRGEGTKAPIEAANDLVADAAEASGAAPPDLVTLEVTPRQAAALAIAAELGKLSLLLRGPGREPPPRARRRWDSDVTGLPPEAPGADAEGAVALPAGPPPVLSQPIAPAPPAAARRPIEIVYGVLPASAAPPEPPK